MNVKQTSETSGFENIGKFYNFILKQDDLKPIHRDVYMLLAKYSFGYTKDIKFEITISLVQISEQLNISRPTAMRALSELEERKLIKRIKWQDFGPKQAYKYKVIFPKDFHIKIKNTNKKQCNNNDIEILSGML
jgi:DNA-binding transcriptional ArsR family regulator